MAMKFGKFQAETYKNRFRTKALDFNKQLAKDMKQQGNIDQHIITHFPLKKRNYSEVEEDVEGSSSDSENQLLNTKRNQMLRRQAERLNRQKSATDKRFKGQEARGGSKMTKQQCEAQQKKIKHDMNNDDVYKPSVQDQRKEQAIMNSIKQIKKKQGEFQDLQFKFDEYEFQEDLRVANKKRNIIRQQSHELSSKLKTLNADDVKQTNLSRNKSLNPKSPTNDTVETEEEKLLNNITDEQLKYLFEPKKQKGQLTLTPHDFRLLDEKTLIKYHRPGPIDNVKTPGSFSSFKILTDRPRIPKKVEITRPESKSMKGAAAPKLSEAQTLVMQPNVKASKLINKINNPKSPDDTIDMGQSGSRPQSHIDEEELDIHIPDVMSKEDEIKQRMIWLKYRHLKKLLEAISIEKLHVMRLSGVKGNVGSRSLKSQDSGNLWSVKNLRKAYLAAEQNKNRVQKEKSLGRLRGSVNDAADDRILLLGKVIKSQFASSVRSKSLNHDHIYDPINDYVIQRSIMSKRNSVPSELVAIPEDQVEEQQEQQEQQKSNETIEQDSKYQSLSEHDQTPIKKDIETKPHNVFITTNDELDDGRQESSTSQVKLTRSKTQSQLSRKQVQSAQLMIMAADEKRDAPDDINHTATEEQRMQMLKSAKNSKLSVNQTISQEGIVPDFNFQVNTIQMKRQQTMKAPIPRLMLNILPDAKILEKEVNKLQLKTQVQQKKQKQMKKEIALTVQRMIDGQNDDKKLKKRRDSEDVNDLIETLHNNYRGEKQQREIPNVGQEPQFTHEFQRLQPDEIKKVYQKRMTSSVKYLIRRRKQKGEMIQPASPFCQEEQVDFGKMLVSNRPASAQGKLAMVSQQQTTVTTRQNSEKKQIRGSQSHNHLIPHLPLKSIDASTGAQISKSSKSRRQSPESTRVDATSRNFIIKQHTLTHRDSYKKSPNQLNFHMPRSESEPFFNIQNRQGKLQIEDQNQKDDAFTSKQHGMFEKEEIEQGASTQRHGPSTLQIFGKHLNQREDKLTHLPKIISSDNGKKSVDVNFRQAKGNKMMKVKDYLNAKIDGFEYVQTQHQEPQLLPMAQNQLVTHSKEQTTSVQHSMVSSQLSMRDMYELQNSIADLKQRQSLKQQNNLNLLRQSNANVYKGKRQNQYTKGGSGLKSEQTISKVQTSNQDASFLQHQLIKREPKVEQSFVGALQAKQQLQQNQRSSVTVVDSDASINVQGYSLVNKSNTLQIGGMDDSDDKQSPSSLYKNRKSLENKVSTLQMNSPKGLKLANSRSKSNGLGSGEYQESSSVLNKMTVKKIKMTGPSGEEWSNTEQENSEWFSGDQQQPQQRMYNRLTSANQPADGDGSNHFSLNPLGVMPMRIQQIQTYRDPKLKGSRNLVSHFMKKTKSGRSLFKQKRKSVAKKSVEKKRDDEHTIPKIPIVQASSENEQSQTAKGEESIK